MKRAFVPFVNGLSHPVVLLLLGGVLFVGGVEFLARGEWFNGWVNIICFFFDTWAAFDLACRRPKGWGFA